MDKLYFMSDEVLERTLHEALVAGGGAPPPLLSQALVYAVFPGGARICPRLCLEVARACGAADELAYAAAAAIELLHCASLVHDDLPCFDAAGTRRGRPSVHCAYGEAMAVLVGDGLMVKSFATLGRALAMHPGVGFAPMLVLLDAAGPRVGLVAGQAWELVKEVSVAAYHASKTASLFEAACALGALVNGVAPPPFVALGRALGMAYQLADDVADVLADEASLGKPTGRDRALGRPTAAGGAMNEALERLARAKDETLAAVPQGEARLSRLIEAVFDALSARLGPSEKHLETESEARDAARADRADGAPRGLAGLEAEGYPGRSNGQVPDPRRRLSRRSEDLPG